MQHESICHGSAPDARRAARVPTDARGSARLALGIELIDVSALGARLRIATPLPAGTLIRLTLPPTAERHARIAWWDDGVAGCEFLAPLTPRDLATLEAQAARDAGERPPDHGERAPERG